MGNLNGGERTDRTGNVENSGTKRRDFLARASGLGGVFVVPDGLVGNGTSDQDGARTRRKKGNGPGQSVTDAGLGDEFVDLFADGAQDDAFSLLEENDVVHTRSTQNLPSKEGVTTQDYFEKGHATVTFYTSEWEGDCPGEYAIGVSWRLEDHAAGIDGPAPTDAAAVAFNPGAFRYVDDSMTASGKLKTNPGPIK